MIQMILWTKVEFGAWQVTSLLFGALGCPDLGATHWVQVCANSVPTRGSSQVSKVALAADDSGATDASPAKALGPGTLAQRSAGPELPATRPPVPFLRHPRPAFS